MDERRSSAEEHTDFKRKILIKSLQETDNDKLISIMYMTMVGLGVNDRASI